ncbi:MAG: sugar ABC transporter substrate-binding protein [Caldilineaceae bacterium]
MEQRSLSRRQFLQWSTMSASALALAACAGVSSTESGGEAQSAAQDATAAGQTDVGPATGDNYSFMTISGDAEAPIFDGLADTYNETVGSGHWTFDRIAGSWEDFSRKYITEVAAGSTHDVARIAIIHQPSYISNGYISDLTPFFDQSGISMDDYYESAFNEWRVDGKLYGIPAGIYNMAIYYNKSMFDELGIPHLPTDWDDDSWNLDAFRATAAQLTSGEGAEKRYGFATNWDLRWVIHFVWAYGGDFVNAEHTQAIIDSPEAVQGLQFAQELIRTDQSWLTPQQLSNGSTAEAFMTGRVGMYLDGMWQMPAMAKIEDFEWGVAPVPAGTYRYTGNYVDAWVMPTGAKNPEESWKFLQFMAGADAQNYLVSNSALGLPILRSVVADRSADLFKPLPPEEQQVWINAANYAHSFPFTAKWDELYDALLPSWDLWGLGEIDAATMAQQIRDVVDPILAQA